MAHTHCPQALRRKRSERACWWLNEDVEVVPIQPRSKRLNQLKRPCCNPLPRFLGSGFFVIIRANYVRTSLTQKVVKALRGASDS